MIKAPSRLLLRTPVALWPALMASLAQASDPPAVQWDRVYGDGLITSVEETVDGGFVATGFWEVEKILLLRTDSSGDTLWTRSFNTGKGYSVQETLDGGFVVAGYERFNQGQRDILIRTDQNGDTLWTRTYGSG